MGCVNERALGPLGNTAVAGALFIWGVYLCSIFKQKIQEVAEMSIIN